MNPFFFDYRVIITFHVYSTKDLFFNLLLFVLLKSSLQNPKAGFLARNFEFIFAALSSSTQTRKYIFCGLTLLLRKLIKIFWFKPSRTPIETFKLLFFFFSVRLKTLHYMFFLFPIIQLKFFKLLQLLFNISLVYSHLLSVYISRKRIIYKSYFMYTDFLFPFATIIIQETV